MTKEGFWNNRNKALEVISQLKKIQNWTEPLGKLSVKIEDLTTALELLDLEDDIGIRTDAQIRVGEVVKSLDQLEFRQMLSGEHDASDCILTVRSGAGGVDSHDWTEMLMKMYIYWAEKQGFEVSVLDTSPGDTVEMGKQTGMMCYYMQKREFTGLFAEAHLTPVTEGIPVLPLCFLCLTWTIL